MEKDPFNALAGNEKLKSFFRSAIKEGNLAHAYILEGEEGTGKRTLVRAIAVSMAGDGPEGERVAKGISQDVQEISVAKDKKTITVDAIRRLKADAYIAPGELSFKMYMIPEADKMNIQAQNAALKLLEEPPEGCYFFLLCHNSGALLPTVRSRAPVMRMERFSPEKTEELLRERQDCKALAQRDPALFESCVRNSGGSLGRAITLLTARQDPKQRSCTEELLEALTSPKLAGILGAVYKLPSKRQELAKTVEELAVAFRDMLLVRNKGEDASLLFFRSPEQAEKAGAHLTKIQMLALYSQMEQLGEQLERNINVQNARMALANGIYRIIT